MGLFSINEAYFGKTPEVMACYESFSKFRQKHLINNAFRYDPMINRDPDLIEFNRRMETAFGFDTFELYVINSTSVNAYTLPVRFDLITDPKKALIKTKNGVKYDKSKGIIAIACIYTGLLTRPELSDGEVFAIILHEIGHNFQEALVSPLHSFRIIEAVMDLILMLITLAQGNYSVFLQGAAKWTLGSFQRAIRTVGAKISQSSFGIIIGYLATFKNFINDTIMGARQILLGLVPFGGLALGVAAIPRLVLNKLQHPITSLGRKSGEYFADSFPVMYGFGPEHASAQAKLLELRGADSGMLGEMFEQCSVLNAIYQFNMAPLYAILFTFDEHPMDIRRIKADLDTATREFNKDDIDPKIKKVIEEDVKKIQKQFDEVYDKSKNFDKTQRKVLFNAWCAFLYDVFGDKDMARNIIDVNVQTDKTLDALPINNVELK